MSGRDGERVTIDSLIVDPRARQAWRYGTQLNLQAKQFDLLAYLARRPRRIVTRRMLAQAVWRDQTATWTNVITVTVSGLRKKIEMPGRPTILHTMRGRGYLLGEIPEREHAPGPCPTLREGKG